MSERRELSRRDMLKIAGVAALGSALGTASVGGGLLYLSRSEPQPAGPAPAKPEYAPPPPAPIAKTEPAPLPLPAKPVDRPAAAAIPANTPESAPPASVPKEELVIDAGILSSIDRMVGRRLDWGMVFHPATILTIWAPGLFGTAIIMGLFHKPNPKPLDCGECSGTTRHFHA